MAARIVTPEDLEMFKRELLEEMGKLFKNFTGQTTTKWLKSYDVRKLLKISPGTLQNLRINGSLPFAKIGGMIFYDFDDVQKMIVNKKVQNPLKIKKSFSRTFDRHRILFRNLSLFRNFFFFQDKNNFLKIP